MDKPLEEETCSASASKLASEICTMTGCNLEQALIQLKLSDFDFEKATNKILESSSLTKKHIDDEWQTINRQKKSKKKSEKVEPSGDSFRRIEPEHHPKYKIQNTKTNQFMNEDKLNNNRIPRNRRNRAVIRKPKGNLETQEKNDIIKTIDTFPISDPENEIRWDNIGDINGALKKSSNNSQCDGFYSDDDFGFPGKLDDNSYRGPSTQLISDIHQKFRAKEDSCENGTLDNVDTEKPTNRRPCSTQFEQQSVNECLTNQLPVFGKYSLTKSPLPLSIIPTQPVSFFRSIKPKKWILRWHYNFGVNMKEDITFEDISNMKHRLSNSHAAQKMKSSENTSVLPCKNQVPCPSDSNFNQLMHTSGIRNKDFVINSVIEQKRVVAMILGNPYDPPTSYFEFAKPINMISMAGSNHVEPLYAMNMHHTASHNIDNGINIQSQGGYVTQPTFPTSNDMSVPFHANRK